MTVQTPKVQLRLAIHRRTVPQPDLRPQHRTICIEEVGAEFDPVRGPSVLIHVSGVALAQISD
jgi:hypothetical protein